MVRLIALIPHQYGLGKVKKGERYSVSSEVGARLLVHRGLAKYDDVDESKKKREYHRRDMKAEG